MTAPELDEAKYISFVSFRKDGTAVPSPVWCVPYDGGFAFTTEPQSWKVKRILANPNVTIQVCNYRGSVQSKTTVYAGTAVLLDANATAEVRDRVKRKYPIAYKLLIERSDRKAARRGEPLTVGTAAIKVTLQ